MANEAAVLPLAAFFDLFPAGAEGLSVSYGARAIRRPLFCLVHETRSSRLIIYSSLVLDWAGRNRCRIEILGLAVAQYIPAVGRIMDPWSCATTVFVDSSCLLHTE